MTENTDGEKVKWYLKPLVIFVIILAAGPFALPLVWKSPSFKKWHKTVITITLVILTVWLIISSVNLYHLLEYYREPLCFQFH